MLSAKAMKPIGLAIKDFYSGDLSAEIKIYRDDGMVSSLAVSAFFRGATDFQIDKVLIDRCRGRVLDVGAGAGIHSLYLQQKGFIVQAMDVSPEACQVMKKRGLKEVICSSFIDLKSEPFDTLLLLGRSITMVGTLHGLDFFLNRARRFVNPGGQILLNSLDVSKSVDPRDITYYEANMQAGRYIGEFRHYMEYNAQRSPGMSLLHVDPGTLAVHAAGAGWTFENLLEEKDGNYAARLGKT
jgi:2-polyprenyl-3-methyl-5-hydroxy-6-metoxy-1,4-benzoquinol methylase